MNSFALACDCPAWEPNIIKVNAPLLLEQARNPGRSKGYDGEQFRYCPWCGSRLYIYRAPQRDDTEEPPK